MQTWSDSRSRRLFGGLFKTQNSFRITGLWKLATDSHANMNVHIHVDAFTAGLLPSFVSPYSCPPSGLYDYRPDHREMVSPGEVTVVDVRACTVKHMKQHWLATAHNCATYQCLYTCKCIWKPMPGSGWVIESAHGWPMARVRGIDGHTTELPQRIRLNTTVRIVA